MKSFLKAYTLPLLVLVLGGGIYYIVFSTSVQSRLGDSDAPKPKDSTIAKEPESTPPSINAQGEIYTTDSNILHLSSEPANLAQNDLPDREPSTQDPHSQDPLESSTQTPAHIDSTSSTSPAPETISSPIQDISQDISAQPNDKRPEAIYYSKAVSLNIRAIPKTSGRILGKLTLGQSVVVVEIQDEWAKLDSGGWVSLALLSPTQPSERLYVVLPNTLNIRQSPESSAPVVGALYKGQKVQVEMTQDEWAKINSGGWVSLRLIKAL